MSAVEAAEALMPVVQALSTFRHAFGHLTRCRDSPREPLVGFPDTVDVLAAVIESGILRNDTDRAVMDGAGYLACWDDNTRRFEQAKVWLIAGFAARTNRLGIEMSEEMVLPGVAAADLEPVLRTIAEAFAPGWISVCDGEDFYQRTVTARKVTHGAGAVKPGWMVFLPESAPSLEVATARVESWSGSGRLYVLAEEWSPNHREEIAARVSLLDKELLRRHL